MTAHVLFVDDEEPNLIVFEAVCGDTFPVLTASSAAQGLKLMEQHEIGVVLTDQRMPGMTGIELLEKVEVEYPDAIRLLITAYSDLQAAEDAINRGHVRRYMRKPWEPETLRAELRDAIDLYSLNTRVRELEQRLLESERAYSFSVVASGLADELRNPLGWIRNNLTVIETSVKAVSATLAEPSPNMTRARGTLAQVDSAVSDARDGVKRILELTEKMAQAPDEAASRGRRPGRRGSGGASQGREQRASRPRIDRSGHRRRAEGDGDTHEHRTHRAQLAGKRDSARSGPRGWPGRRTDFDRHAWR